uniref:Cobalamin binding intrinsic factor n=1 Tax=Chelonoidis abingdonii TaxID=106734 RepID=A0A8C0G3Z4_CHEAB
HLWLLGWLLSKEWVNVCFSPSPVVPANQQYLVTELQYEMESSVTLQSPPNPSILIALNLAGTQDKMTSGEVALYVLALLSSCEDPKHVTANISLVEVLKLKTKDDLPIISSCLPICAPITLLSSSLPLPASCTELYTGAMATLALTCVHNGLAKAEQTRILELIHEALDKLRQLILRAVETNTANIYSIGLALQALNVTSVSYPSGDWSCSQTLAKVLTKISQGAFDNPMAAAQILPSLVGKTYLNVIRLSCSSDMGKDHSVAPSPTNAPISSLCSVMVEYTIINQLRGQHFTYTIHVSVPKGSVLLSVLQAAQQDNPQDFSFETKQTSWGLMVVSINSRAANSNDKTYWQFFNGTEPLEQALPPPHTHSTQGQTEATLLYTGLAQAALRSGTGMATAPLPTHSSAAHTPLHPHIFGKTAFVQFALVN